MSVVIKLLQKPSYLGLKTPWTHTRLTNSNSRYLTTDPPSSVESDKKEEKKSKQSLDLDEFTKNIVE